MNSARPKRQIIQKTLDYNNGLLWKEEKELRRALYASLHSVKQPSQCSTSAPPSLCSTPPTYRRAKDTPTPTSSATMTTDSEKVKVKVKAKSKEKINNCFLNEFKPVRLQKVRKPRVRKKRKESISSCSVNSYSETDVDEPPKPAKRSRVHAQRKFAQSLPGTPNTTPIKSKGGGGSLLTTKRPKTEDFLTFLCLRGSPVLPTRMEVFGAPPSPDNVEIKEREAKEKINTDSQDMFINNEDSGLSFDRISTCTPFADNVASPASSITELTLDESTSESIHEVAKMRGKVTTPVNTHISSHSPPPGMSYKPSSPPSLQPVPPLLTMVPKRAPPALIPIPPRCSSATLASNPVVTSPSLVVPPPIMSTGIPSRTVLNHSISSPLRPPSPQKTSTDKEAELGTSSLKELNHIVEKVQVNNARTKPSKVSSEKVEKVQVSGEKAEKVDRVNKAKKSKPPKLLYIPPKKAKLRSGEHNTNVKNHSIVTLDADTKMDTSNANVVKPEKVKPAPCNRHDAAHKNNMQKLRKKVTRSGKNHIARDETDSPAPKAVSASTRNTIAKQLILKSEVKVVINDLNAPNSNSEDSKMCQRACAAAENSFNRKDVSCSLKRKRGRPPGSKNKQTSQKTSEALSSPKTSPGKIRVKNSMNSPTSTLTTSTTVSTVTTTSQMTSSITRTSSTSTKGTSLATVSSNKASSSSSVSVATNSPASDNDELPNEAKIYDAPVFHPTEEEWSDPIAYIKKISDKAQPYGMCKVVPPEGWRPECKLNDDLRFTTQLEYVHRMQKRWGPNVQQLQCIKKHLAEQGVELTTSPQIGGCELDLVRFSQTMAQFGGLQNVPDKKRWNRVADSLRIPKAAQDRLTKLDDIYCKYLLSYDMLSKEEKDKLERQVTIERQRKSRAVAEHERNSCTTKGRSVALTQFYRVARNTMSLCFKNEPTPLDVEQEYWRLVDERTQHVAVQCGRVDTATAGSGFPTGKSDPYSKHSWNLNNLSHNQGNLLHHLGQESGVTVPWLKIGMLFSTEYWKQDRHALPCIEYMHTGAGKIWYCVPHSQTDKFEDAIKSTVPEMCLHNSKSCIAKASVMVSPSCLVDNGVPVMRTLLKVDEYLVTFPACYTASVSCGYNVAECVYYALPSWIDFGTKAFALTKELRLSTKFAMERLLSLATTVETQRNNKDLSKCLSTEIRRIRDEEFALRDQLVAAGLQSSSKMSSSDNHMSAEMRRKKITKIQIDPEDKGCDICGQLCYLSMVVHDRDDDVYCLQHAYNHIKKGGNRACRGLRLMYRYDKEQLNKLVEQAEEVLSSKNNSLPGRGRGSNKRRSTESDTQT